MTPPVVPCPVIAHAVAQIRATHRTNGCSTSPAGPTVRGGLEIPACIGQTKQYTWNKDDPANPGADNELGPRG